MPKFRSLIQTVIILFTFPQVFAAYEFPNNLSADQRETLLREVGFSTSSKFMSSVVPLGGYEGAQFGIQHHLIPLAQTESLKSQPGSLKTMQMTSFFFAKGLPFDIDLSFTLVPPSENQMIQMAGLATRWSFYQHSKFPLFMHLHFHGATTNFQNLISTRTSGGTINVGYLYGRTSVYAGYGLMRCIGTFTGGSRSLAADQATSNTDVMGFHTLLGLQYKVNQYILGAQVDKVSSENYSLQFGLVF